MLLDLKQLASDFNLQITGVIHLGAHLAEEAPLYAELGINNVWWVEALPQNITLIEKAIRPYGHKVINALVTDVDHGKQWFNVTNYDGMSSSIYEFGKPHLDSSPDTVFVDRVMLETRTVDSLAAEYNISGCNMLCMDLQGAELLALRGASKTLDAIDYVYTEVNSDQVYIGCAQVFDLDSNLWEFTRVETSWTPASWGDALYVRTHPAHEL